MRGVVGVDLVLLCWAVLVLLAGVGAWGVWRSTAGRGDVSGGSGRDVSRESFPAYDVPVSWDEARALSSLLGVLVTILSTSAGLNYAGYYYRGEAVDVSKIKADALLYGELLRARLGAPRSVDDD